jgi:hypothetical protein
MLWSVIQVLQPYLVEEEPCEASRNQMYASWDKNLQWKDNACTHPMYLAWRTLRRRTRAAKGMPSPHSLHSFSTDGIKPNLSAGPQLTI